ncbi:MAG: 4-alpha-glucanotransferase [Deltaproteobacteria bacterium]|nr:4-alpha-glucanotransferase [Deltaproteobacteria bacterium]
MIAKGAKFFARLYGVERTHLDLWGNRHNASLEQLKVILAALGFTEADLQHYQAQAKSFRLERCQKALPPVFVDFADKQHKLFFYLPEELWFSTWTIVIKEESGTEHSWSLNKDQVKLVQNICVKGEIFRKVYFLLPENISCGYHELHLTLAADKSFNMELIIAPHECYLPEANGQQKRGIGVQLYSLRSPHNWGFGQFSDLKIIANHVAKEKGNFVGLNPIHAVSLHNLDYHSPYSPVSRSWLNVLYLDIEQMAEDEQGLDGVKALLGKYAQQKKVMRDNFLLDYGEVRKLKLAAASELYGRFVEDHIAKHTPLAEDFLAFKKRGGQSLGNYACYEALSENFISQDKELRGWPQWPQEFQDPQSSAVKQFRAQNAQRIDFYCYLQWHGDRQMSDVLKTNTQKNLDIGLYIDLALSSERGGADIWQSKDYYALDASVGCPPDQYAPNGQNWAFPPLMPHRLRAAAYQPFIEVLKQNLKYAGALRIDHAMSFSRLFWIPLGAHASEGLYVRYPLRDLLAILALESQRNKCIIVGEDLGTVPQGFRELMAEHKMLAYKVFFFMRTWDSGFQDLSCYTHLSLVTSTTHDLYTLRGYWEGEDINLTVELGYLAEEKYEEELAARQKEKERLLYFLKDQQTLAEEVIIEEAIEQFDEAIFKALIAYLQKTSCYLLTVPIEDLVGQIKQVNMPGVTDGYDSWRHRLPQDITSL